LTKYSIIIPTFNRLKYLVELLESIEHCEFDLTVVEVIVVNDGSTDGTGSFLSDYLLKKHRFSFNFYDLKNNGPAYARNHGASKSIGTWLIFIDDDCLISKSYFSAVESLTSIHSDLAAISGYIVAFSKTLISRYIDWSGMMLSPFVDNYHKSYFITANALVRKDVFFKIGGFNLTFKNASGEDVFLSQQIRSAGFSIYFDKKILVRHRHRDTFLGLIRTCNLYGKGHFQVDYLGGTFSRHNYFRNIFSAVSVSLVRIWRSKSFLFGFQFLFLDIFRSIAWTHGYKKAMNEKR
jgi:glycosyltransferase involved in cell wall biosynthesis